MTVTATHSTVDHRTIEVRQSLWTRILDMIGARHQRKTLRNMDEHTLRDIGVTRKEAFIEAKKPVWDVPRHWSR